MALGVGTHLAKSGKQAGYLNSGWGAQRLASNSNGATTAETHWIGFEEAMSLRPAVMREGIRAERKVVEHTAHRISEKSPSEVHEAHEGIREGVQYRAPSTEMERGARQIIIERLPGNSDEI